MDRLKPFVPRAGAVPAPGPVSDAGQEGEHEVEQLLNRRTLRGVTRYLVRWHGHTSADDEWVRVEDLGNCPVKVAEYEAAALRRRKGGAVSPRLPAPAPATGQAMPEPPAGFRLAAVAEVVDGAALVGRRVLYWWPDDGWLHGRVARARLQAGFSHVVAYSRDTALGRCEVDTLLDLSTHGLAGRWWLLCPSGPPGAPPRTASRMRSFALVGGP